MRRFAHHFAARADDAIRLVDGPEPGRSPTPTHCSHRADAIRLPAWLSENGFSRSSSRIVAIELLRSAYRMVWPKRRRGTRLQRRSMRRVLVQRPDGTPALRALGRRSSAAPAVEMQPGRCPVIKPKQPIPAEPVRRNQDRRDFGRRAAAGVIREGVPKLPCEPFVDEHHG